jgi:hypothetical protein
MKPITFQYYKIIPKSAVHICTEIADVARWSEFGGYGMMPGIAHAAYETQTADMVGSRIRVRNTDGSEHVEEIYKWVWGEEVAMKFTGFTPPLSRLATHFTEEWHLQEQEEGTAVTRRFALYATRPLARPVLWLISLLFRRAIARHLDKIAR